MDENNPTNIITEWNSGVIQFEQDIFVDKSVLGKMLIVKKCDAYILFEFPKANEESKEVGIDYLHKPTHALNYKVNWGEVYERPKIKAGIKTIACYTKGINDDELFTTLSVWRTNFINIMEVINECLIPKAAEIVFEKYKDGSIDFYSGVSMSRLLPTGGSVPIHDLRSPEPIKVYLIDKDCYADWSVVKKAIIKAFQKDPLPQTYYLLLDAYHAFKHKEFRGAVTLGGIALEHCILEKIKRYSEANNIVVEYPIGELGKKFAMLKKLKIAIPIQYYKDTILKLRNAVMHQGIQVSEAEAADYLKNCRIIINEYEPLI